MQKVKIPKRVGRQLYRSSPTILTVVASVGVIVTTITAVRATPKAIKLLKEAEAEKGGNYPSGWTVLYSFYVTWNFNHCLHIWSKRVESKETDFLDECIRHA
jgi:hypothetical protein